MLQLLASSCLVLAFEGPTLQLPWACGTTEACTQDHQGGSHTGSSAWAWDFALQEGEEIWAASAGEVTHLRKNATLSGCDPAFAADANYVTIDHGDGTAIIYAHMQTGSIPLKVGDIVEVGDLIGKVGHTGYSCGSHLHMAVQEQCGSSHCQSVSAAFAVIGDAAYPQSYESGNCPACTKVLDGGVTVVDDQDAGCMPRVTTSWWSSMQGHAEHHFYTLATDADAAVSSASWRFSVEVAGDYLVEVFVPDEDADTENALYLVHDDAGTTEVAIDQANEKGWQPLGTFAFSGAQGEGIELGDATGENIDTLGRRIAYDAVRFTFVPGVEGDDDGGSTTGAPASDTGDGSESGAAGSSEDGSQPPQPDSETTGADTGPDGGLPDGFGAGDDAGGCACRAEGGGEVPFEIALGLGVVVLMLRTGRGRRKPRSTT
jgi:hypothetical protein